jgi:hypothetical protein
VPQNANGLRFDFNFFSAEYPEYVCREFNDRFVALLSSRALDEEALNEAKVRTCVEGREVPECNVSFDRFGEPVTINNGFFGVCRSDGGNVCTHPETLLAGTGYDLVPLTSDGQVRLDYNDWTESGPSGGATGWLTTRAPVQPNEEITLRFIVFDEGDARWDSAVLIDNLQWELKKVDRPTTNPVLN